MKRAKHIFSTQVSNEPPIFGLFLTKTPYYNYGLIGEKILSIPSLCDTIITYMAPLTATLEGTGPLELENIPEVEP